MTRFGVMKHLRVLEEAGLVVDEAARAREAALPEPGPDQARPRPLGEQVRGAVGGDAHRPQAATGGGRRWKRCSRSTSRRRRSACGRRSPTRSCARRTSFGVDVELGLDARLALRGRPPGGERAHRRGREPRGRPAAPARAELQRALERRRQGRGHLAGDLGDRAGRRLVQARRDARPAARGRATTRSTAAGRRSCRASRRCSRPASR